MIHIGPVDGDFETDWKPTGNPSFICRGCGSNAVIWRQWNSACGGYRDINYHCKCCNRNWWVESDDA